MNIKEQILAGKQGHTFVIFKNLFPDTPSWQEIFEHMSWVHKNPQFSEIHVEDLFYIQVPEAYKINKYKKFLDYFNKELGTDSPGGAIFFDLLDDPNKGYIHLDTTDNFHWQIIGKTQWEFGKIKDDQFVGDTTKLILEQGDVVFIPSLLGHRVIPLTPRAGSTLILENLF